MWTSRIEPLKTNHGLKFAIDLDAAPIAYADVLDRWRHDAEFRAFYIASLKDIPYSAFRWETPSITKGTANRPFEFVVLDSPGLASVPDPKAFAEWFDADRDAVEFANLGKDAILVVPCPKAASADYAHLAAFVRQAPVEQIHSLWRLVGDALIRRLGKSPVWLSTAGAGVSWLHVRLDDRPKYYGYGPYR